MKPIWSIAALAAFAVVGFIVYVARSAGATQAEVDDGHPARETVPASWCADGLELLDDDACFAAPRDPQDPVTLVVYLHGRYGSDGVSEELDRQARLARLATERNFAVLAVRGARGECTSPDYKDYFCWPSNEHNESDGPRFVARFSPAITRARERLGPGRNVLLGFSNGGYFAALIATRALARFDQIVIAHGGPVEPTTAAQPAAPMLLITADDDASDPEMRKLDEELERVSWPHVLVAREGGHSLPDWDLDVALTFFERTGSEAFPLSPPLPSRSQRAQ